MGEVIFRTIKGDTEEWLQVNEDGSATFTVDSPEIRKRNGGWQSEVLDPAAAERRWPDQADIIRAAVGRTKGNQDTS